jgi:hypothetical protein
MFFLISSIVAVVRTLDAIIVDTAIAAFIAHD